MSGLLRSGKLLRIMSGLARPNTNASGLGNTNGPQLVTNPGTGANSTLAADATPFFNPGWSAPSVQSALPALGVLDVTSVESGGEQKSEQMIDFLVADGHHDLAFNLLVTGNQQNNAELANHFLQSLVKHYQRLDDVDLKQLVSYADQLKAKGVVSNGKEVLLEHALASSQFDLSLDLARSLINEGHQLMSATVKGLIELSKSESQLKTCLKTIRVALSRETIERFVLPKLNSLLSIEQNAKSVDAEKLQKFLVDEARVKSAKVLPALTKFLLDHNRLVETGQLIERNNDLLKPFRVSLEEAEKRALEETNKRRLAVESQKKETLIAEKDKLAVETADKALEVKDNIEFVKPNEDIIQRDDTFENKIGIEDGQERTSSSEHLEPKLTVNDFEAVQSTEEDENNKEHSVERSSLSTIPEELEEQDVLLPSEPSFMARMDECVQTESLEPMTLASEIAPPSVTTLSMSEPPSVVHLSTPVTLVQIFNQTHNVLQWIPLANMCALFRSEGRFWDLEHLLEVSSAANLRPEDRQSIYVVTLQCYADQGLYDRAIELGRQMESEGLMTPIFEQIMAQIGGQALMQQQHLTDFQNYDDLYSRPESTTNSSQIERYEGMGPRRHRLFSRCPSESSRGFENNNNASQHIEALVKQNELDEAANLALELCKQRTWPQPKIFRFLLNRLALKGQVDVMEELGSHMSSEMKKEVSFDNRLCNAYLAAGRGESFLTEMERQLEQVVPDDQHGVQRLKDKFPRGGAMGLLEQHPELVARFTKLSMLYLEKHNYMAPLNVLWAYHFIHSNHEVAQPLWEQYVRDCPQIMFQKICQTARTSRNAQLAKDLVQLLHSARVTSGAQGIAYSCLLDVLSSQLRFEDALTHLVSGMDEGHVRLEDVNRTALLRLRDGLERKGLALPFNVPDKRSSHFSRSFYSESNGEPNWDEERSITPI